MNKTKNTSPKPPSLDLNSLKPLPQRSSHESRYTSEALTTWLQRRLQHLGDVRSHLHKHDEVVDSSYQCTIRWTTGGVGGGYTSKKAANFDEAISEALAVVETVPEQRNMNWSNAAKSMFGQLGIKCNIELFNVQSNGVPAYSFRAEWSSAMGEPILLSSGTQSMIDDALNALIWRCGKKVRIPVNVIERITRTNWTAKFKEESMLAGAKTPYFLTRRSEEGLVHRCKLFWADDAGVSLSKESGFHQSREAAYNDAFDQVMGTASSRNVNYAEAVAVRLGMPGIQSASIEYTCSKAGSEANSQFTVSITIHGATIMATSRRLNRKCEAFDDVLERLKALCDARTRIGTLLGDIEFAYGDADAAVKRLIASQTPYWKNEYVWLDGMPIDLTFDQRQRMDVLKGYLKIAEGLALGQTVIPDAMGAAMLAEVEKRKVRERIEARPAEHALFLLKLSWGSTGSAGEQLDDESEAFLEVVGKRGLDPDEVLDQLEDEGLITTDSKCVNFMTAAGAELLNEHRKAFARYEGNNPNRMKSNVSNKVHQANGWQKKEAVAARA